MRPDANGFGYNLWLEGLLEYPYLQQVVDIDFGSFLKKLKKNPLESFAESERDRLTTACWALPEKTLSRAYLPLFFDPGRPPSQGLLFFRGVVCQDRNLLHYR